MEFYPKVFFYTSIFCRVLLMFSCSNFGNSCFTSGLWSIWSFFLLFFFLSFSFSLSLFLSLSFFNRMIDTGLTSFFYSWTFNFSQYHLFEMFFSLCVTSVENFQKDKDLQYESCTPPLLDLCPRNTPSFFTDTCCNHVHCCSSHSI